MKYYCARKILEKRNLKITLELLYEASVEFPETK